MSNHPIPTLKLCPPQIYGMQLSAPCRLVEMVAEVLGLEYEFVVVRGNSDNCGNDDDDYDDDDDDRST